MINLCCSDSLERESQSIKTVRLDISDWTKTKDALSGMEPIDLLVNNAGEGFIKPLEDLEEEDVDR